MLNLVQLQERLKGVPMQALMQYANGSNPQVPPFLALGELNRRKKMQEEASADQAQQMEGAPSIKDQIEQSAGLLALQGNRQRQAAQQQQAAQQAIPMAAPNTTTSEPAQMAGGGFVDDIVVPRDYQMGGQVQPQINPEMLKRLMMLKAMKQKPGLAGLQTRPDMFKRSDYAGGGIVAFDGTTNGSLVRYDPEKDVVDESEPASSLAELIGKILPGGRKLITEKKFKDPKTGEIVSYDDYMARVRENERRDSPDVIRQKIEQTKNTGSKPEMKAQADAQQSIMANIVRPSTNTPANVPGTPDAVKAQQGVASLPFLRKLQNVNLDEMFPVPEAFNEKAQFEKQKARKEMYGVSDQYLTDAERRLEERMGKQAARRAEQPMDQLISFLGGIAGGRRGGTWGTQGAEGAMAAQKLSMAQQEANERQDEANDQLRMAIAEKRQALARGDMEAAAAAERDIKNAINESNKAKLDFLKAGAQAEAQGMTAQASLEHARRPSAAMEAFNLWQKSPTAYEAFKRAGGMGDENFMLRVQNAAEKILEKDMEYRTLQLSPKPEDKQKAAQIRQNALNQAMRDLQMISSGVIGGSAGGQRIKLDAQGNVISQ